MASAGELVYSSHKNHPFCQHFGIKLTSTQKFVGADLDREGNMLLGLSNTITVIQLGKDFNMPYKRIEKDYFFHNLTRANVGSIGIVGEVPEDAITSPEYQVWKLTGGFLPDFMALLVRTKYFLSLVAFNRVGGVKQRMYYANLAEIRLPMIDLKTQEKFAKRRAEILAKIESATTELAKRKTEIEEMILGTRPVPK